MHAACGEPGTYATLSKTARAVREHQDPGLATIRTTGGTETSMAHPQHHERMARIDGCPSCLLNTEPPRYVHDDDMSAGFLAYYDCTDCGHSWRTGWADERPGSAA